MGAPVTLRDHITKAAAFVRPYNPPLGELELGQNFGTEDENARLRPLLSALSEVAEAAELSLPEWERETVGCRKLRDALARLSAVVGGKDD